MSMERITSADLKSALAAHLVALDAAGVTFEGRLGIEEGSRTYGRAFRLFRTAYPFPCQVRDSQDLKHEHCTSCNGTRVELTSGHGRPPVGDDYLGMTKREAYYALTARTAVLWDVARAREAVTP